MGITQRWVGKKKGTEEERNSNKKGDERGGNTIEKMCLMVLSHLDSDKDYSCMDYDDNDELESVFL